MVWLAINALGWQIPCPSPSDQQVSPRETRGEQSTPTGKGTLVLADSCSQAPLGPPRRGWTHEGQATFQPLTSCKSHPLQMQPLLQLQFLSSVAGLRRVLALAESVNNLHHPKRNTDPAPRPPAPVDVRQRAEEKWRALHLLFLVLPHFFLLGQGMKG